jgi:hypothetical protein
MMNNSTVRAAAAKLAAGLAGGRSSEQAVRRAYALALGRPPKSVELSDALEFLSEQRSSYREEKKPKAEQLALTDFCQVLLGLNEFVYVD